MIVLQVNENSKHNMFFKVTQNNVSNIMPVLETPNIDSTHFLDDKDIYIVSSNKSFYKLFGIAKLYRRRILNNFHKPDEILNNWLVEYEKIKTQIKDFALPYTNN